MSAMRDGLAVLLEGRFGDGRPLVIEEPRRLGGGSSQENWAFDVRWGTGAAEQCRELLLRRDPASGVVDTPRAVEFALLEALQGTGVPAPRVHALDDGTLFGRPAMVVDRLRGSAHRAALRGTDPLGLGNAGRSALARSLPEVLAAVHTVDVEGLGLDDVLGKPPVDPAAHELERWVAELDRVELEPQPGLRFVAAWLEDNLPVPVDRPRLVHGDFRPANVLVDGGRLEALLDWELAHLGDPHDDLGWYTCSVYRGEHFIPGDWEIADFLTAWSAASGLAIEPGRLHFWQVMSTFRLAVIALTGVANFVAGTSDRPTGPADRVVGLALAETGARG